MRLSRVVASATRHLTIRARNQELQLNPLWLRLNDPAQHTANGQRLFEISDVVQRPSSYQVQSFRISDEALCVDWADGQTSTYNLDWLEARNAPRRLERHLWKNEFRQCVPTLQYSEFLHDEAEGKLRISSHLDRYGIALLRGVPAEYGMVEVVGNKLGNVRVTNYGSLFDVLDKGLQGNNLANTSRHISAHTDNPYRDPYPGVQLLHCLRAATEGGATVFTDGFAVADFLRKEDPDAFSILATTPQLYEYKDPELSLILRAEVPVFTLDKEGSMERVAFNNRSAATFRGPMSAVQSYYRAWAKFDRLCNSPEFTVRLLLEPGDLIIFMNGRVMHGRESYTPGGGRHLQGAYIDHDEPRSRVLVALADGVDLYCFDTHGTGSE